MALDVSVNGDRKKLGDKVGETLRFDLELDSPTDDTFNEFSYLQLVRERKKKVLTLMHSRFCIIEKQPHAPVRHCMVKNLTSAMKAMFLVHFQLCSHLGYNIRVRSSLIKGAGRRAKECN